MDFEALPQLAYVSTQKGYVFILIVLRVVLTRVLLESIDCSVFISLQKDLPSCHHSSGMHFYVILPLQHITKQLFDSEFLTIR